MEKRNIKLVLSYDGSKFLGWQRLNGDSRLLSLQGLVEQGLEEILGESIQIIGASRTDATVHAKGQVANFYTRSFISTKELQIQLNQWLPKSVQIQSASEVKKEFHSRYDSIAKVYEYRIDQREKASVFTRDYCLSYPKPLKVECMKKAANLLVGTHDFKGFSSQMKDNRTTTRTIHSLELIEEKQYLIIRIQGDGFLYNMIRIIVGTLLEVGEGIREVSSIDAILKTGNRQLAGPTINGIGLTLCKVLYKWDE